MDYLLMLELGDIGGYGDYIRQIGGFRLSMEIHNGQCDGFL